MTGQATFGESLRIIKACPDAVEWVGNKTLAEAWKTCERADWMLWLCGKYIGKNGWPTRQEIVLTACDCAETVKHLWPKDDDRPAAAIRTARAWAHDEATLEEVRDAADTAYAAATAAADAAAYAAATADAAAYASLAADAAAYAAAYAAWRDTHLKMCILIRDRLHPIGSK